MYSVDVIAKLPRKGEKSIYQLLGGWVDLQEKYGGEVYAEEIGPLKVKPRPAQKIEVPSITEAVMFQSKSDARGFAAEIKRRYGNKVTVTAPLEIRKGD